MARILAVILVSAFLFSPPALADHEGRTPKCFLKSNVFADFDKIVEGILRIAKNNGKEIDEKTKSELKKELTEITIKLESLVGNFFVDKKEDCPAGTKFVPANK